MPYPEAWMDELLSKSDIVSVISSYVDLKPKGHRYWGLCPLHGEKTASFSVNADKQLFYCFGCHAGGDVIQFLKLVDHLTYPEAVERLAQRAGMTMPEISDDSALLKERAHRERLYDALRRAARFYMETLLGADGLAGRQYFSKRGIDGEAVKRFGLGYAKEGWDNLRHCLTEQGFTEKELVEAGLLVQNPKTGRIYDAYRGRVIFPIQDISGRVLGFGARVLNDDKPKYINTGDTPVYNKRNNLYGLNLQKGTQTDHLILVEGYADVIGLYACGVKNAVASLGTALTVQQARLLKRLVSLVYIAYDGDAAGQNATVRGLDILSDAGVEVRVIVFPDGLDPDEFIRQRGADAFEKLKDNALSLNAFKLDNMAKAYDLTTENGRERYGKEACAFISGLQPVEQERYYRRLAQKTGYPVETLTRQGQETVPAPVETGFQPRVRRDTGSRPPEKETARGEAERKLLQAMEASEQATVTAVGLGAPDCFAEPVNRKIAEEIILAYAAGEKPKIARIIPRVFEDDGEISRAAGLFDRGFPEKDAERAAADCIRVIRRQELEARRAALAVSLNDPTVPDGEKQAAMKEITDITNVLKGY